MPRSQPDAQSASALGTPAQLCAPRDGAYRPCYSRAATTGEHRGRMGTTLVGKTRSGQQLKFGELLRHFRIASGMTQEELAERSALSPRGISDLERSARTHPYPATVRQLAQALDLSPADGRLFEAAARASIGTRFSAYTGLPTPFSSFIGRDTTIAEMRGVLATNRLVTLLGPGGIGKTRLAVEVATRVLDEFADGVVFVGLANLRDPDLVVNAIAHALGIQDMDGGGLAGRVQSQLRTADLLLVLDNFEHLLPATQTVGTLLTNCRRLKLLITSRAALRLSGEREIAVQPLTFPDPHEMPAPEQLAEYEAVRLFMDRAASVRPQLSLNDRQGDVVARICARLDGLPLAIELVVARLRVLSPEVLLERLARSLPLLVGGARDLPARQQTLTATISWSYDLLDPAEQRFFRRVSVFVGGFTLEAAEAVCGSADLELTVVDALESLLAKSLVGHQEGEHDGPRFRMLETVREYALDQARIAGEVAHFRRRHAEYFLRLARLAASNFASVNAPAWLQRLETDHNNLRASLSWALEERDADTALGLSSAIWHFWYARGYLAEGSRWLDEALRLAEDVRSTADSFEQQRARALTGAGVLAHYQGHYARAAALCGQSLALSRQLGDQAGVAGALHGLALVARSGGDFATARTMYEEARRIHEALADRWGLSYTLRYLGVVLWMEADYTTARAVIEASLSLASEIADTQGMATTLTVQSYIACSLGQHPTAEAAARDALSRHETYGDRRGAAQALWALGMATAGQSRYDEANAHHKHALSIFHEVGDRYFMGVCFIGLAQVAMAGGRPRDAVCLLAADSAMMTGMGAPRWPSVRPYIQQTLDQARLALSDSVFEQAWSAGEALTVDQAVALGMAVRDPHRVTDGTRTESNPASPLTVRQVAIARGIARGLTNKQIAAELVIAEGTADRHVANILERLGFASRAQIAAWVTSHLRETESAAART
jgi:predicted ATPase/DNA-binding CsgD family transcriptional regulator/DNA-binding XRE family transcriptional regulator